MKVSWLLDSWLPGTGKLGLVRGPGVWNSDRDADLAELQEQGAQHLICLQEAHEFERLEPPETPAQRREAVLSYGMDFTHEAIEDFQAPTLAQLAQLITLIRTELTQGRILLLHCWAGLGRAGTIASCVLVSQGMSASDAIASVRWVRPGAVQSEVQEQVIAQYAISRKQT